MINKYILFGIIFFVMIAIVWLIYSLRKKKSDYITVGGNNGTCSCNKYCATNWASQVTAQRPKWKGSRGIESITTDGKHVSANNPVGLGKLQSCKCGEAPGPWISGIHGCAGAVIPK